MLGYKECGPILLQDWASMQHKVVLTSQAYTKAIYMMSEDCI